MGLLAQTFIEYIGPSGDIPTWLSPLAKRTPLQLLKYVPVLGRKSDVSPHVSLLVASEILETYFEDDVHLFTHGSIDPTRATATAAYFWPSMKIERTARLNLCATWTSAELRAI